MSGRFLLRKVGGRFEAVRRAMRSVVRAVTPPPIASLALALALWCLLALALPIAIAARTAARSARTVAVSLLPTVVGSVLVNPFLLATGGAANGSKIVTIDHTKFGATDATNFAVPIYGTYSYLADAGHGGQLTNVNNLAFFSDAGFTSVLKFERVFHSLTTGQIVYWVKVPTVSHTTDTVIYMAWDSGTSDLSDTANTWLSAAKRSWHLGDGSTLTLTDSTTNAGDLTNVSATAAAGPILGAASFNGTTAYLVNTTPSPAVTAYPVTFTCWAKSTASVETVLVAVVKKTGLDEYWMSIDLGLAKLRAVTQASGSPGYRNSDLTTNNSSWHHYAVVFTSASTRAGYQDGVLLGISGGGDNGGSVTPATLSDTYIGGFHYNTSNLYQPMNGQIAEPRIYNDARSVDWLLAEKNCGTAPVYTLT